MREKTVHQKQERPFVKLLEVIIGCLSALTKVKASKKEAFKFQADHKCRKFKNMNV